MSDYVLTCSSVADLPKEYTEEHDIGVIAYHLYIDGTEYLDTQGREIDETDKASGFSTIATDEFFAKMREGAAPSTSMVNAERYMNFFRKYLEQGQDVLHLEFSSGLSGSYGSAVRAARELEKEFPGRRVVVLDTLSATLGYGLLVMLTEEQKENGATLNEAAAYAEKMRGKIAHWFIVDDLEYLRRGGRLSRASAVVGTMLNLKPTLSVNQEGKVVPVEKVRGKKKAVQSLLNRLDSEVENNGKDQIIIVGHADVKDEADQIAERVREKYPEAKEVQVLELGPVLGAHVGPGMVGITYVGSERTDIKAD